MDELTEINRLLQKARRMDGILNDLSQLGGFGDPAAAGVPTLKERLNPRQIDILMMSNDLCHRIVSEKVEDSLRSGYVVKNAETKEVLESEWDSRIKDAVIDGATQGRAQGGALVWVVTDDSNYKTPLEGQIEVKNLVTLDRHECTPATWETSPVEERFDKPKTYYMHPSTPGVGSDMLAKFPEVHSSRVLEFGGTKLPRRLRSSNDWWDDSVLQLVWPSVRRFNEVEAAISTIVHRFETAIFAIAGLQAALESNEGLEYVRKRMQMVAESMSILNAALIDADSGESMERKFASVTGLDTIWDRFAHSVSKASGTPMTQLFGMSPAGLSSDDESGRANWRKQLATFQDKVLRPQLEKIYRLIHGVEVVIEFNPADELTAAEKATILSTVAQAYRVFLDAGSMVAEEARAFLIKEGMVDPDADFEALIEADIERKKTAQEALAPPEPAPGEGEPPPNEGGDGKNPPPEPDE